MPVVFSTFGYARVRVMPECGVSNLANLAGSNPNRDRMIKIVHEAGDALINANASFPNLAELESAGVVGVPKRAVSHNLADSLKKSVSRAIVIMNGIACAIFCSATRLPSTLKI